MTLFPLREYTKQSQLQSNRIKPTQRMMGDISAAVRKRVNARTLLAPVGCCERCMRNRNGFWTLEQAHIDSRKQIDHKTTEYDLLRLCGPSTNSKTCHRFAHTGEGKVWMMATQIKLQEDSHESISG